ncbi:helix-turn-helix domain-containing protein [Polynucleobacter sp. UK-Kesae-W10]|uniref:helix-turn-helix domain-containing protein n=1 Tax=Polynucleobacter sp. UK-Kesae-W10 TaxID=1819738 RepID=UPI001C0E4495|nr:helix-turn-helix domain-containing protein [Polynucleobacter sp. UK-Kesae-W10]MBU3577539.1 helix-turn-helix domain-containing protein [Polynucleobacter sp. UK-Kesae-W10]
MSQCADILEHMQKNGPITAIEALTKYGCFRLAARIKDLREEGHEIETEDLELPNGKTIAKYALKAKEVA